MHILDDQTRERVWRIAQGVGFTLAFLVWIIVGLAGSWRTGAIAASWISLVAIGIAALMHLGHSLFLGLESSMTFPAIFPLTGLSLLPVGTLVWANYHGWAWLWAIGWLSVGMSAYQAAWEWLLYASQKNDGVAAAASLFDRRAGTKRLLRKVRWVPPALLLTYLTLAQLATLPRAFMVTLFVASWLAGIFVSVLTMRVYLAQYRRRTFH